MKNLRVRVSGVAQVREALRAVKDEVAGPLMLRGVQAGCRKVVPVVRQNLSRNRLTSATTRSIGVKVQKFRDGQGAIGLVGPRRYHRILHPAFGYRSRGLWRQTNPGTTDPPKILHLIEGGRKAVRPTKAKVLALVVPRLDGRRKPGIAIAGGEARKLGKKPTPPKRVPGGFLIFARSAGPAREFRPMRNSLPAMQQNAVAGVVALVQRDLPRIAAKAAARGRSIFRG